MKKVIFSSMRNGDFSTLSKRVLETMEQFDTEALGLTAVVDSLKDANAIMNASQIKDRAFAVTSDIQDARAKCLRLYASLRFYTQAFLATEEEALVGAAAKILRTITVYGRNIRKSTNSDLIMRIGNFISEIEGNAEKSEAITLLGADKWMNLLKNNYAKLGELDQERAQESRHKPTVKSEEGKAAIREAIQTLYRYVEAMALISGKPVLTELEQLLGHHAERNNLTVKQRLGSASESAETAETPPAEDAETEVAAPTLETSSV